MWDLRTILRTGMLSVLILCLEGVCLGSDEDVLMVGENGTSTVNERALNIAVGQVALGTLSPVEEEGLLYMAEEEKLAGDIYQALDSVWNLQVFDNIGHAERTHESAVVVLINRYGLDDPTTKEVGRFNNATLQRTYDELVSRGKTSLEDALKVGAEVEEIDIIDLEERINQTDKEDIRIVYENLMRGSENHLRAFVSNLNRRGYEYAPVHLSKGEYDNIVNSS